MTRPYCCTDVCKSWRVATDLLFEQGRSKKYAVCILWVNLCQWSFNMMIFPRTVWARSGSPLYRDCRDNLGGTSSFAEQPCSRSPMTGPIWELLAAILVLAFTNTLMTLVNNPYRSKLWAIPAILFILWMLTYSLGGFLYLFIGPKAAFLFSEDEVSFFGVLGDREKQWSNGLERFSLTLWWFYSTSQVAGWCLSLVFLVHSLSWGPPSDHYRSYLNMLEHTKSLLRGSRDCSWPVRCQALCEKLRPPLLVAGAVPTGAVAALREEDRLLAQCEKHRARQMTLESLPPGVKRSADAIFRLPCAPSCMCTRRNAKTNLHFDEEDGNKSCTGNVIEQPKMEFPPGKTGLRVSRMTGRVIHVDSTSLGARYGVQCGWQIKEVNGKTYAPELLSLSKSSDWTVHGSACTLIFGTPEVHEGDVIQALPGKSFTASGIDYYRESDRGRISKLHQNTVGEDVIDILWYRTGKTSRTRMSSCKARFKYIGKVPRPVYERTVMLWLSAAFALWIVGLAAGFTISMASGLNATISPKTNDARTWAATGVYTAERSIALAEELISFQTQLIEQQRQAREVEVQLSQIVEALAPVPVWLQDTAPEIGTQVKLALSSLNRTERLLSFFHVPLKLTVDNRYFPGENDSDNKTQILDMLVSEGRQASVIARELQQSVDGVTHKFEDFLWSVGVTSIISSIVAFLCVVGVVCVMVHRWSSVRKAVATGEARSWPTWQPNLFHPVRAPGLPGMMASSALFGFYFLFTASCVTITLCWWAPEAGGISRAQFLSEGFRVAKTVGGSVLVKTILLDQLLGRRILTKRGFVVHWALFAWYITVVIPLTIFSGVVLALTRFIMLIAIAAIYIVRVDITLFPPGLLQGLDSGYTQFMSAVILDHRQRNPIWAAAVTWMLQSTGHLDDDKATATSDASRITADTGTEVNESTVVHSSTADSKLITSHFASASSSIARAACKWQLAVTLANNPSLIQWRKHVLDNTGKHVRKSSRKDVGEQEPRTSGSAKDLNSVAMFTPEDELPSDVSDEPDARTSKTMPPIPGMIECVGAAASAIPAYMTVAVE